MSKKVIVHNPELSKKTAGMGLGDVVATFADPVAKVLDAVIGTKLSGCEPCGKRREHLNTIVPDVTHPFQSPKN